MQVIHEAEPVKLQVVDLQTLPEMEREAAAQQLVSEAIRPAFDLAQLPLVRWTLLRVSEKQHRLLHVEHHLVHDGWSFNVFLRELLELYKAFSMGKPSPLLALPIQFADFAQWQREWVQGAEAEAQLAYWQKKLAGSPSVLALPLTVHDQQGKESGAAPLVELPLRPCGSVESLSRQEGVTLFMTMLTAFVTLSGVIPGSMTSAWALASPTAAGARRRGDRHDHQ